MEKQPVLNTKRLALRAFEENDIPEVTRLAGDIAIADTVIRIPHPYSENDASEFIERTHKGFQDGKEIAFAITQKETGDLLGSIGINPNHRNDYAEIGYWVGKPYWGNGYASEAALRILQYGFEELKLNRIHAHFMVRNPASGRVLQKIGMKFEGRLRQYIKKNDNYEDIDLYSMLRSEYEDSLVK